MTVTPLVNLTPGLYGPGGPVTIPGQSYGPTVPVYGITPVTQPPSSGGGGSSGGSSQSSQPSASPSGGGGSSGGGATTPVFVTPTDLFISQITGQPTQNMQESKNQIAIMTEAQNTDQGARDIANRNLQIAGVLPYGYGGIEPRTGGTEVTGASGNKYISSVIPPTEASKYGYKPYDEDYNKIDTKFNTDINYYANLQRTLPGDISRGKNIVSGQESFLSQLTSVPTGTIYELPKNLSSEEKTNYESIMKSYGVDTSDTQYTREELMPVFSGMIQSNKDIISQQESFLSGTQKNINVLKMQQKEIGVFQQQGYSVDIKDTGLSFNQPSNKEIHDYLYPGASGTARLIGVEAMSLGIPALVSSGLDTGALFGPVGIATKLILSGGNIDFKYTKGEQDRLIETSLKLTSKPSESNIDFTKRFWTSSEAIESVYLPLATLGVSEVYTLAKGGATGAITAGKIAGFAATHPTTVQGIERSLWVVGGVGAGMSGVSLGMTAATNPERLPSAIGQTASGWILAGAGFKLGETFVKTKYGINTQVPKDTYMKGKLIRQDINMGVGSNKPNYYIEPINDKLAMSVMEWKPQSPMYGVERITGKAVVHGTDTGMVDYTTSLGRVNIYMQPTRSFFGTVSQRVVFGDIVGGKVALTGMQDIIPYKSSSLMKIPSGPTYSVSKGYGFIGKTPGVGEAFFESDANLGIKIASDVYPMVFKGSYLSIRYGGQKSIGIGTIKEAGLIAVAKQGEGFFIKPSKGYTTDISTQTGILQDTSFISNVKTYLGGTMGKSLGTIVGTKSLQNFKVNIAGSVSLLGLVPVISTKTSTQSISIVKGTGSKPLQNLVSLGEVTRFVQPSVKINDVGIKFNETRIVSPRDTTKFADTSKFSSIVNTTRYSQTEVLKIQDVSKVQQLEQTKLQNLELKNQDVTRFSPIYDIGFPGFPGIPAGYATGIYGGGWNDYKIRGKRYRKRTFPVYVPFQNIKINTKIPGV